MVGAANALTPSEISALKLALDSDGLRVFNTVSLASRLLAFTAGGLAGLLDSTRPAARGSALWAGMTCNTEQGA